MFIENIWDYATTEEIPMSFKITSSGDKSPHTHSFVEIFYIVNGSIPHKLDGGVTETLSVGDMFIIMPEHIHTFLRNNTHVCSHRDIIIRESFFREVCNFIDPSVYGKLASGEISCKTSLSPLIISSFEKKISILNQMLPTTISQKKAIIKTFAVSLLEPFLTNTTEKHFSNFPSWFKELLNRFNMIDYMKEGLNEILKPFNYDKKYLCRVFKKFMGTTMTEYLNHIRLDYALNMIQNTNKNILDIAQDLGFSSVSYFNVIFKKRYGITPLETRQNNPNKIL